MSLAPQSLREPFGQIAFVGVAPVLVGRIEQQLSADLAATRPEQADCLFSHMESGGAPIDAVVLGLPIDDAVRLAQRIHTHDKLLPIMILSEPSATERLRRTLMFSPFVSNEVAIWSTDDVDVLPAALHEAVNRRRQRMLHHNTLSKAQIRLEKLPLQQPDATHYLDRLLDHAPVGVMTVDLAGTVTTLNPQAQRILASTDRQILGQPLRKFFPTGEHHRLSELQRAGEGEAVQRSDVFQLGGKNGRDFFIEITSAPLAYRTGQRVQMLILQDVTSRIEAEQERQRAEEELRVHAAVLRRFHEITSSENMVLEQKLDQVLLLGCQQFGLPTGVLSRVSHQYLSIIQSVGDVGTYPAGSQHPLEQTYCGIALNATEPLAVSHAACERWQDHPAYKTSKLESYIGTAVQIEEHHQGTLCFFGDQPRQRPFSSADSELMKLMSRWISSEMQRRRAEALMRKLSGALERTADAIMITDRARYIEFVNPSFERLTGYTQDEVIGKKTYFLRSGLHDDRFYDELWQVIGKGEVYRGRLVNRKKDGSLYHEQKTISPLKDHDGRVTNYISVGHDITDLVEAEEKNRAHHAELAHVARLSTLGEMTSGLAHELNQPLCAITTYAQTCLHVIQKNDCNPERVRYGLEQVVKQAALASAIFRRLRDFARKGEIRKTPVSMASIIREVAEFTAAEAHQKCVRLERNVANDIDDALADPIQIEQVLLNLVRNAIDSVTDLEETRRRIVLTVTQDQRGWIVVDIRDSGKGCPPEMLERLFEPFATSKAKGLGIGLSISQGIIEAHGGSLCLAENSELGAVFRFTLPTEKVSSEEES